MFDIYTKLSSYVYFIDNEYLKKYCHLIQQNVRTKQIPKNTHKHHIVPKSWFKLQNKEVDNTLSNLVNLKYREHILAHYYLCLCTEDPFKYANQLALECLLSIPHKNLVDKALVTNFPLYNNIYEDYISKKKSNYKLYINEVINDNKGNS